jgi:hypothetical protein
VQWNHKPKKRDEDYDVLRRLMERKRGGWRQGQLVTENRRAGLESHIRPLIIERPNRFLLMLK